MDEMMEVVVFDQFSELGYDELRNQIENDDPACVVLEVGPYNGQYSPDDDNWGRFGEAIGNNTCLKILSLSLDNESVTAEESQAFLCGVARNRSLKQLHFTGSFYHREAFSILVPFFQDNHNFECLDILDSPWCLFSLAPAIGKFISLKELKLCRCALLDNSLIGLTQKLTRHSNLRSLDLSGNPQIGRLGYAGLTNLLQNTGSKLAMLSLGGNRIHNEVAATILARGLAGNNSLKKLDLSQNKEITKTGWVAIFTALRNPNCKLENLDLHQNTIDDAAALILSTTLSNSHILKTLNMKNCPNITNAAWQSLFESLQSLNSLKMLNLADNPRIATTGWGAFDYVLQSPNSSLEQLNVSSNGINDETVNLLANALANNKRLRELSLGHNNNVNPAGWVAFSSILQNPDSALEQLDLSSNDGVDGEVVSALANSLADNSTLKELLLENNRINFIWWEWEAFSRIICNDSSIMTTYGSNHTLQKLLRDDNIFGSHLPEYVSSLLELNRENGDDRVARLKIIKTHFREGFNTQPFLGMEQNTLPHALAWMGAGDRADGSNSYFYDFLRRTTTWFD